MALHYVYCTLFTHPLGLLRQCIHRKEVHGVVRVVEEEAAEEDGEALAGIGILLDKQLKLHKVHINLTLGS